MLRNVLIGLTVLSLGFFIGCEKKEQTKQKADKDMVVCTKCQAVWVREPVEGTGKFTGQVRGYSVKGKETCSHCKANAQKYFSTGKMEVCESCGEGSMCVCTMEEDPFLGTK